MAAQKGKDLLLKVDNGTGSFITIGGLRTRRLAFNTEAVDITHAESAGRWRELLAGAGMKRASIAGSGIFKDEGSDLILRELFFEALIRPWQIIIPNFGRVEGPFQLGSLDYRGDHAGEVSFELSLESAGFLAFTAL